MTSPFGKLPVELLKPIFAELEVWELPSVVRTCKAFKEAAEPFLYLQADVCILMPLLREYPELVPQFTNPKHRILKVNNAFRGRQRGWHKERLKLLQKWKDFAEKPIGKHVSNLTVDVINFDPHKPMPKGFTVEKAMNRLFNNLNVNKIISIKTQHHNLQHFKRFQCLKTLLINFHGGFDHGAPNLPAGFSLPQLESFEFDYGHPGDELDPGEGVIVVGTICEYLSCLTSIKHVDIGAHGIENQRDHNLSLVLPPRFIPAALRLMHKVKLANLKSFSLRVEKSLVQLPFRLLAGNPEPFTLFHLLAFCFKRHAEQIETMTWISGLALSRGMKIDNGEPTLPPFPNLTTYTGCIISPSFGPELFGLGPTAYDILSRMAKVNAEKLESLVLISFRYIDFQYMNWLPRYLEIFA